MRHLFYIPASYTALLYGLLAIPGLLVALYIGVVSDLKVLLGNNCGPDHWEFWPSISSAIGDKMPERQMWRIAFVLCSPFRIGTSIALFSTFFQKGCGGMSDITILLHSPRKLLISSAFLSLVLLWSDLWRVIGALVWTVIASSEHLTYHNLGFGPYIVLCFILQVVLTTLTKRNIHNMNIYTSLHEAEASYRLKRLLMIVELASSVCLVASFIYHKQTCAPGSYSLTSICEWVFALSNVLYDMTAWYELRQEGWMLGGSPAFYRQILPVNTATSKRHSDRGVAAEAFKVTSELGEDFRHSPQEMGGADVSVAILSQETGVPHSMHTDSPKTLTPPNGSEHLESDKVVVHTFTICCAPSNIHLWLCDIYWAHLLVEMFIHVVEHTYFQPLVAMALSWEMISFFFLGSPVLLRIASFRRWATGPAPFARTWLKPAGMPTNLSNRLAPMYVFFYFLASFSHLHMLIQRDARRKILGVSYGPFFLALAVFCRYLYPSTVSLKSKAVSSIENSRRMIYALPLGLVLGMLLRILHITIAPMFVNPSYSAVFGILLGLNFTVAIYREAMFSQEDPALPQDSSPSDAASTEGVDGETPLRRRVQFSVSAGSPMVDSIATLGMSCPAPPSALLGCLMGLMFCMTMTFYNCANYIPRLVAVEPYPASLMVVAVFALGVYFSPDVLPIFPAAMHTSRRGLSLPHRWMQLLFKGSLMRVSATLMVGLLLLLFATRQSNFTYEADHPGYPVTYATPKAEVKIENWRVQTDFRGSKHVAFGGGLLMTFCVGALFPVTMELVWAHQRARRFLHLSGEGDAEAIYKHEAGILFSFEMAWFVTVVVGNVLYALVISYPFVPMAWIVREKSRPLMLTHFFMILLFTGIIRSKLLRHKNIGPLSSAVDGSLSYRQRMMHKFVAFLIMVAFLFAIVGRGVTQPGDVSYPEGKKTALEYPEQVLHLHDMMVDLRKARNIITDPYLHNFEVAYYEKKFKEAMNQIERSVTVTNPLHIHPRYKLGSISDPNVRRDIFNAAKAMTFFSGMIWTVHFALDNYNVDSLDRMVQYAKQTEAGVVGLLESDTMHVSNGNRDMVEYLSYYMGYRYTDYGPTSLDNTYGCGLISRYPILNVHRYVTPSPLGELGCMIHAELDVYGIRVHTYVGHFGNTEHYADGLLQSQFLGSIVVKNAGPSLWLGYLVTHPGDYDHYRQYSDPGSPGKFRDTAYEIYTNRTWTRLTERGGFEEQPPLTVTSNPWQSVDFNVEYKLTQKGLQELEKVVPLVDNSFRRTPRGKPPRHFYFNDTNRYSIAHPRFEFVDRYCQYNLYKTGRAAEELPDKRDGLQPYRVELFDWWRKVDGGVEDISDTEIQVTQLRFRKRTD